MDAWWHRYPDQLIAEEKALSELGYPWRRDEKSWESGRFAIDIDVPHEGEALTVRAEYPDTYPYFPPVVSSSEVIFRRHQHPLGKNLCLLAREAEGWNPGRDTLAGLLESQLPAIQAVNAHGVSEEVVAEKEDHVGEPLSSFLDYDSNCFVIVPDHTPGPQFATGKLKLSVLATPRGFAGEFFVRGTLSSVCDPMGKELISFPAVPPGFDQSMNGYWMRLKERPALVSKTALVQALVGQARATIRNFDKAVKTAPRGAIFVVGFVFQDEVVWRENADDWIFLAIRVKEAEKGARRATLTASFVRADWGGEAAWMRRAPALVPLRQKRVLLFGLGSLGSPLAVHLARAGIGHVDLVDYDFVQVGNTIRWALGWQAAGVHKALALAGFIVRDYPYTSVRPLNLRIGDLSVPNEQHLSDYHFVRGAVSESDLVIDATANHRVSHFLADLSTELGKPYLWLTTTHGAAGGVVGRIRPGVGTGCWHCFQHSLSDKSIRLPADSGAIEIQPGGCSQPTFLGAGIDSDQVALLAGRLAAATLCAGELEGYPDFDWDVAVGDFNRDGLSIAPDWTPYKLTSNRACSNCGTRE